jgi:hypothetical protein
MSDRITSKATEKMPLKSGTSQSASPGTSRLPPLPQSIRVLGVEFRVEVVEVEDDIVGDTVGLYRRIRVSKDVDSKKMWSVLVHEWVHAVLYVNGIGNILDESVEEVIAQSMEHAIEELLKQVGPELLKSFEE